MIDQKLISVLMPVYNAGKYLEKCLDSICDQSETNWELIAIDDHSSDNSFDILKQYALNDSRIQVFKNDDKGIVPALEKAFQNSSGGLITRMDADDIMHTEKLHLMKSLLTEYGMNHLVTGLVSYFSDATLNEGYRKYEKWLNKLSTNEDNFNDIYRECVIPSPCWMCFREDLDRAGGICNDVYPEDYDLCFRFRRNGMTVKTVKEKIHFWRDHSYRTSRNSELYADNRFISLKLKYFIEDDYAADKKLVLWGAGKKGKAIAKALIQNDIQFEWLTNNTNKSGHDIYGLILQQDSKYPFGEQEQIIVAIAQPDDRIIIEEKLASSSNNVYYFC